jgi:hypothetical protein
LCKPDPATKGLDMNRALHTASATSAASLIPVTPAEAAVAAVRWERRGILGRLVRVDEPSTPSHDEARLPVAA